MIFSENRSTFRDHALLVKHDLFRKPVPTFRDHALLMEHGLFRKPVPTFRDHAYARIVRDEARRQFSEKELADLSMVIAMINGWNRLAMGARSVHPADHAKAA
jgi:hypothetical protein